MRVDVTDRTCTEADCTRTHYAHGYCTMHYKRARKRGDFEGLPKTNAIDITGQTFGLLTAIRRIDRRWECACECGATTYVEAGALRANSKRSCGDPLKHHRVGTPSYRALHTRIATERGKASDYPCVDCGQPACEWTYDHTDPSEVTVDGRRQPYSFDISHYEPRCKTCHRRQDSKARGGHKAAPIRGSAAPRSQPGPRIHP